ncbi:MAG TPA: hypothetical protein VND02_03050, partial [Actinomycetota bacterium]|nr:hypothetical protein [Actinomycetota bacterium]
MTASKLARVLAISVVLAALSLSGTAHAQESDDPPAQGGVTQPDPDPVFGQPETVSQEHELQASQLQGRSGRQPPGRPCIVRWR